MILSVKYLLISVNKHENYRLLGYRYLLLRRIKYKNEIPN